jgi:hypothetical protein
MDALAVHGCHRQDRRRREKAAGDIQRDGEAVSESTVRGMDDFVHQLSDRVVLLGALGSELSGRTITALTNASVPKNTLNQKIARHDQP